MDSYAGSTPLVIELRMQSGTRRVAMDAIATEGFRHDSHVTSRRVPTRNSLAFECS
jgi:transcriptional regulator of heat shock response